MSAPRPVRPIPAWRDRWSGEADGVVVLDLGEQPASDHFPEASSPGPDPRYRVRLVLGSTSGLLQLEQDETTPEEPLGIEPAALVEQAALCVADAVAAGLIPHGGTVIEYPSPHGGSWGTALAPFELIGAGDAPADLIVDVHGMMHDADQRAAFSERAARLADDGVLLMMIYNATAIVRDGAWNAVRNGHFAYYTTPSLVEMAHELGLVGIGAWSYPLYNDGTTMLAFSRSRSGCSRDAPSVTALIERETAQGVLDPTRVAGLGHALESSVAAIRDYLDRATDAGLVVYGYGAASRTVALLSRAGVTATDITAIADASAAKQGRAMPVSRIPIVSPAELVAARPDRVLLFVGDLLPEVRGALPEVEESGGRWVIVDPLPHEVPPSA